MSHEGWRPEEIARRSEAIAPRLAEHVVRTPLRPYAAVGEAAGAEVLVKCEHLQRTGSFKARGSLAKLLGLTAAERDKGVVTASSGNHGLGVANALAVLGGTGLVLVPESASPVKVAAIRRLGARIWQEGDDAGVLEAKGRAYAAEHGLTYVPPYDDPEVMAGQGTLAVELMDQLEGAPLDAVFVSVGGGGLISGVAAVLKRHRPDVRVYGVSPAVDDAMAASVRAGRIVHVDGGPTLSDGTAGNLETGARTLDLCRQLVDDWVLVDEAEIAAALRLVIDTEHELIEGAAALAFAGVLRAREALAGQRVAVVSCGANISADKLAAALASR